MINFKNSSIRDTFNTKLKMSWVWLVIVLTLGLTVLFYFSQKPQIMVYSKYIKELSEYQLMESSVMRSMDKVRVGFGADTYLIETQTMTLREAAVAFSREMDELHAIGVVTPTLGSSVRFEREVLSKVAAMRRYASLRNQWIAELARVSHMVASLPQENATILGNVLDSARSGMSVSRPADISVPDSVAAAVDRLLNDNAELSMAWSKFDNEITLLRCEELIQFFQMASLDEMALKSKIPMVFYFLSLVLLLSTFFFLFKSRL